MGKSSQPAHRDCGRDYSQRIDLCLNEGDEVVDCELIIVWEHEIAVGRMKELGYNKNIDFGDLKKSFWDANRELQISKSMAVRGC